MMIIKAGIIGLGGFSGIILKALEDVRGVRVVAAADIKSNLRQQAMTAFNISKMYESAEDIFSDKGIDLVIIATPPFLHAEMGKRAMESGKHVFFEKPGSISVEQMEELIQLSKKNGVIASIDFVMRRNPLYFILKRICETGVFGLPERIFLENYAHDDSLPPDHWFWDYDKSGGIWVEHGVHFFDLVRWLIGPPLKSQALKMERDEAGLIDRVSGWAVHENKTLVSYYHGFTKPEIFEKTTFFTVFERAYVQAKGWIPVELTLDALMASDMGKYVTNDLLDEAKDYLCGINTIFEIRQLRKFDKNERFIKGRGKDFSADGRYMLTYSLDKDRWEVYRACVRQGISDLASVLRGEKSYPDVTLQDAKNALDSAFMMENNT